MVSMRSVCLSLASVFACAATFIEICSVECFADTLPSGGHMMTVQESASLFGQSFEVSYLDSSGVYRTSSAVYQGGSYITDMNGYVDDAGYLSTGREFLFYRMVDSSYALNTQPQNVTVRLKPQYSIFDTEYIFTSIAVLSADNDQPTSIAAYNSPTWKWIWHGNVVTFDSVDIASNDVLPHLNFDGKSSYSFDFVRAYMSSQGTTSGSSIEATFDHVRSWSTGADVFIMVGCPYISSNAYGGSGTIGTSSSVTTSQTISVNVDLDETNGLLGGIISAIEGLASSIVNGISSLFIPTQEQLTSWKNNMQSLLSSHLGGLYQAIDIISDWIDNLTSAEPSNSIHINQMSIPLSGETFIMGPYDVPLKYDGLSVLYDGIALIIDFLCTAAFLNMCRNKLEIFLNPNSEKIEE